MFSCSPLIGCLPALDKEVLRYQNIYVYYNIYIFGFIYVYISDCTNMYKYFLMYL